MIKSLTFCLMEFLDPRDHDTFKVLIGGKPDLVAFLLHSAGWKPVLGLLLILGALLPRALTVSAAILLLAAPAICTWLKARGQKVPAPLRHSGDVPICRGRTTAVHDGGFVVFLIGARHG